MFFEREQAYSNIDWTQAYVKIKMMRVEVI